MIVVLGGPGTGKSLLLAELAALLAVGDVPARVRTPAVSRHPGSPLDIVDAVDVAALGVLAADPAPPKLHIIALRAGGVDGAALRALSPRLRVIELGPLESGDVQRMIDARLIRWGLPKTAVTARAGAKIRKLSAGNPAAIDRIINQAIRLAIDAGSSRVLGEHIDQAATPDSLPQAHTLPDQPAAPPPEPPAASALPPPLPAAEAAISTANPTFPLAEPEFPLAEPEFDDSDLHHRSMPTYSSVIAELAAKTAVAMEAAEARRTIRRRRYGMAAALICTAAISVIAVTGTDRLSSAVLSAESGFLRVAKTSLPGPGLLAIRQ